MRYVLVLCFQTLPYAVQCLAMGFPRVRLASDMFGSRFQAQMVRVKRRRHELGMGRQLGTLTPYTCSLPDCWSQLFLPVEKPILDIKYAAAMARL